MYKGYLIDLDGIAYKGTTVIESCIDFINYLKEHNIPFAFITNNSTRHKRDVYSKLTKMGYDIEQDKIVTSSMVTAEYIKNHKKDATVFLIGMQGIHDELMNHNLKLVENNADYVVIGLDSRLTYEKLAVASLEIANGATFISTNMDYMFPSERGIIPGNGSITKTLEYTTGVKPIVMGKPERAMLDYALSILKLKSDDVAIVGDNYHTDLMLGINNGVDTLFVETGVMSRTDLEQYTKKPTHIVNDLSEWIKICQGIKI
ncbi:TIGR01457 family HAD-type hydrolase [Haloplasma contractile]|uniref:Phosphatasehaloacid dehalogenase family protein n=1 Tax=Haloplasma contractile SSD-17B TaxID=1033810 RepID=U2EEG1_9MOLU|nr:TIGR01457 family HAD-type hydrolase [Haloplasma contractile]ERJ13368.1 Phosphatasehaloacid dehalogenase family protein [Haloplasma contractile SSD-17B]